MTSAVACLAVDLGATTVSLLFPKQQHLIPGQAFSSLCAFSRETGDATQMVSYSFKRMLSFHTM